MTLGEEATKTALKARLAAISNVTDVIKKKIKEAAEKGEEECTVFIPPDFITPENLNDIADWLYEENMFLIENSNDNNYTIIWGRKKDGYISK